MADFLENVEVGHYRSLDMPKNFAIRVKIKKITSASFLPGFRIGSQHDVQEGAEMAGEAVEMPEIGRNRPETEANDEAEEMVFYWQQKAFSQREMEIYSSDSLYGSGLEQHYKDEVQRLRERGGRPNRRLFCYVDEDAFVNLDEESRTLTSSPTEVPSFLVEKMLNVRQRNVGGSKLDRRHRPGGFSHHINPVTTYTSEIAKDTAHVISTTFRRMHIMADLAQDISKSTPQDEYTLCTIKIDINGQILVKPDFNGGHLGYRIETQTESRDVYEYMIEHCSQAMTSDQKEQEIKSFNELYNRHALYLQSQIGQEFESVIEPGVLRLDLFGEIEWTFEGSPIMSGVTHTCNVKAYGEDDVAHFCFPFEYSLVYDARHSPDAFVKWPLLFVEVMSLDSWERHRTEGYGYTVIPNKAGSHEIVINTWRPIGNGPVPELRRFFIGGSPELEDPTYPQQPVATEEKVLSKFYFRTATSGSVTIRLNVVQQCQAFMESKKSKKHARTLLDRLGGTRALDSLGQVMDAFQRARKRMISARETLPTIK
ncbi:Meckel syndrome type 1 protein isoform X2 [Nematostella vectensis]|uniref:Meckel syndrome type 1 protein isoform X2 n=1 Tax=Nematostella vectensis TaxID=45351 RepID=UPI00207766E4|nr:Meckel syndrome type 1 protein isoform X2 [Nematostella vectensis]